MRKKIATAAVAIGCLAVPVLGMGTANAEGSTAPFKVNVGFSGNAEWSITWDASSANVAAKSCKFVWGGIATPPLWPAVSPAGGIIRNANDVGASKTVQVDCEKAGAPTDRVKSSVVHIYGPRGALNDLRTRFSNDTQGMFGS